MGSPRFARMPEAAMVPKDARLTEWPLTVLAYTASIGTGVLFVRLAWPFPR